MSPENQGWFILGLMLGALGLVALIGLLRLCSHLATLHFERREKQKEINETIQQLEDHINKE